MPMPKKRSDDEQEQRDREDRRREDLDDATSRRCAQTKSGRRVPGDAGSAHLVDGHDEVEPGEDRREPEDEDAERHRDDVVFAVVE